MKAGDVVSFVERKAVIHAVIVRWSGDPDRRALLMDASCGTYPKYESQWIAPGHDWMGLVLLRPEEAEGLKQSFAAQLKSKEAANAIKEAAAPVTHRGKMNREVPVRSYYTVNKKGPAAGRGHLPTCQEPLGLGTDDADLTSHFRRHLDRNFPPVPGIPSEVEREEALLAASERTMVWLDARYPRYAEIVRAHGINGEALTEIARRMGLHYRTVQSRWRRGRGKVEAA